MNQELKGKLELTGCLFWIVAGFVIPILIGVKVGHLNALLGVISGIVSFFLIVYGSYQILIRTGNLEVPSPDEGDDYIPYIGISR